MTFYFITNTVIISCLCGFLIIFLKYFIPLKTLLLNAFTKKPSKNPYNIKSPRNQNFLLPYNYILYIADNRENPKVLEKLQQTCKYFFSRRRILMIDWLQNYEDIINTPYGYWKRKGRHLKFAYQHQIPKICNVWLKKEFRFDGGSRNLKYIILPKIYHLTVKILLLKNVILTKNDFDFLNSANVMKRLLFFNVEIKETNNKILKFSDIYEKCPYLVCFRYERYQEIFEFSDFEKLIFIPHLKKIKWITISANINSEINSEALCKFIKENADPENSLFKFDLIQYPANGVDYRNFEMTATQMLKTWELPGQKPKIFVLDNYLHRWKEIVS